MGLFRRFLFAPNKKLSLFAETRASMCEYEAFYGTVGALFL